VNEHVAESSPSYWDCQSRDVFRTSERRSRALDTRPSYRTAQQKGQSNQALHLAPSTVLSKMTMQKARSVFDFTIMGIAKQVRICRTSGILMFDKWTCNTDIERLYFCRDGHAGNPLPPYDRLTMDSALMDQLEFPILPWSLPRKERLQEY